VKEDESREESMVERGKTVCRVKRKKKVQMMKTSLISSIFFFSSPEVSLCVGKGERKRERSIEGKAGKNSNRRFLHTRSLCQFVFFLTFFIVVIFSRNSPSHSLSSLSSQ